MTSAALILHGDCRRILPTLQDESVQVCVTSPPYPWQREYLAPEHPDKHLEIGREDTLDAYLETIVGVFEEVRRVLKSDGTLWLNLGDKYVIEGGLIQVGKTFGRTISPMKHETLPPKASPKAAALPLKNLIGIPWRVAFALQEAGWILRSDIIWDKSNAIPASVTDRPTQSHEYVFLFSKAQRYFYDQDAIREAYATPSRVGRPTSASAFRGQRAQRPGGRSTAHDYDKGGRNARSVWRIAAGGGRYYRPCRADAGRACAQMHPRRVQDWRHGAGSVRWARNGRPRGHCRRAERDACRA